MTVGGTNFWRTWEGAALQAAVDVQARRAWPVAVTAAGVFVGAMSFGRSAFGLISPAMRPALGLTFTQVGLLAAMVLGGYLVGTFGVGRLVRRFGTAPVVGVALALVAVGLALTGAANGYPMALLAQVVAGVGAGCSTVPAVSVLASWFPPARRGVASGIAFAGAPLGMAVSGQLVPRLLATGPAGWRLSWWVLAGLVLLLALAAWLWLHDGPLRSTQGAQPAAQAGVWRTAALWRLGWCYATYGFASIPFTTFFGDYLIGQRHLTPVLTGQLWSLAGLTSVVAGPLWGALSDRIGRRWGLTLGYGVWAFGLLLFIVAPGPGLLGLATVVVNAAIWSLPAITSAACGDLVGPVYAATAFGFLTLFPGTSQFVAPPLAGVLRDVTGTFTVPMLGAALLAALGALLAVGLRRARA